MKFAVVQDEQVINVIVAGEDQKEELEQALGMELVDAQPYNLEIGDLRVNGNWTRNVEGEQVILTERPTYTQYEEMMAELESIL